MSTPSTSSDPPDPGPGFLQRGIDALFGGLALLVTLAVVATVPVLQILCLGYLLVVGVEVARGRPLREAFPALPVFSRLGSIALGLWVLLWIPRLLASLGRDADLIDPGSSRGATLRAIAIGLAVVFVLHAVAAVLAGGRLRHLLWPRPRRELAALRRLLTREGYVQARDAVWDAFASLRLPTLAKTGLLGLGAAVVWLLVPTTLLALGSRAPALGFVGALLMTVVVLYLPFLQLRVAEQGRLSALMDIDTVQRAHAGAPLATAFALLLTIALSLPLYLLQIELVPREALWLPGLVFIAFMLPARIVSGWAFRRGLAHPLPRHRLWRIAGRLLVLPVAFAYAAILYLTQYLSWHGTWSLYEQHAFALPVPFLGG